MFDLNLPSPIIKIDHPLASAAACELFVKREDLIHPDFGGNKWRKLKYNIEIFKKEDYTQLVTFGGPFSNHIAATASISKAAGIACTGIIRGVTIDEKNPTLIKAKQDGMEIIGIPKIAYKQKQEADIVKDKLGKYKKPLLVPEGGSNALAREGVKEMMLEIHAEETNFDHVIVSAGTGMTAAGIISGSRNEEVHVINALRNPSLESEIKSFLKDPKENWTIHSGYTFGGYAKVKRDLSDFINQMKQDYKLPLDPVYNGKAMYACLDLLSKKRFFPGSKILYMHTGGLQGVTAFNYINKDPNKALR